ncbi:MAG: hypothetical protein KC776_02300 [Myxococcales bacterium]|nr:hypothetical protein [Myxococcales bacterium]MCB9582418.1 hypothetical protein [Polyangiaceae bacterium]
MLRAAAALAALTFLSACSGSDDTEPKKSFDFSVVTFNTGTTLGLPFDGDYTSDNAAITDQYYGNGLSWKSVIADTRAFFDGLSPDVVGFQEIFWPGDCAAIPAEDKAGYVCDGWKDGDPTVTEMVLGAGYQVACHQGHPDKCLGVKKSFGSIRGCTADLCLDGLDGAEVTGCGHGSRLGRAVVDLAAGGEITVVNVHGNSGLAQADQDCRAQLFALVFEDLGNGEPAANGARNVILGDFNTDPGRNTDFDESAQLVVKHVGDGKPFHFVTDVGPEAPPTYAGFFDIDHVISDAFDGSCWTAGITDGHPAVTETVYFDHKPAVCTLK